MPSTPESDAQLDADCPPEVQSYIAAITRLNSAIDTSNQQHLTIRSLSDDIRAAISHPAAQTVRLDLHHAQLRGIIASFAESCRRLQNPETTPDDLLDGLPYANPEWFSEKASFMEQRADLYAECIAENGQVVSNLRQLLVELELATLRSQMLAADITA